MKRLREWFDDFSYHLEDIMGCIAAIGLILGIVLACISDAYYWTNRLLNPRAYWAEQIQHYEEMVASTKEDIAETAAEPLDEDETLAERKEELASLHRNLEEYQEKLLEAQIKAR